MITEPREAILRPIPTHASRAGLCVWNFVCVGICREGRRRELRVNTGVKYHTYIGIYMGLNTEKENTGLG